MTVFVVNKQGQPLMPTTRVGKVRRLLKSGKAVIYKRDPFTIQLQYDTTNYTQPMELCVDTGYLYVGCSVKSEKKERLPKMCSNHVNKPQNKSPSAMPESTERVSI